MSPRTVRRWSILHRWSSLICTLFLLILCVTGLPLIFHDEINRLFADSIESQGGAPLKLDEIVAAGRALHPDLVVQFIVWEDAAPGHVTLSMAETPTAYPTGNVNVMLDSASATPVGTASGGVMDFLFTLHAELFLGPFGPPLLGLVSLLFLLSLVSGIVLYAPFMRRMRFGEIRHGASRRARTLDWHNLLGITAAIWLLVVGGTGWINAWGGYIFQIWRAGAMAETPAGADIPPPGALVDQALEAAMAALPDTTPAIIAYPGSLMSDPYHYAVYARGVSPLESRMLRAALIDADTGALAQVPEAPWYITMLMLSQPLHFGDYGGLALKLLWAILDIIAIAVLWTGLRLWVRKKPA